MLLFSPHLSFFYIICSLPVLPVKSWSRRVLIILPDLDASFVSEGKMAKIPVSNPCQIQRTLWDLCAPERNAAEIGNEPSSLVMISMLRALQFI